MSTFIYTGKRNLRYVECITNFKGPCPSVKKPTLPTWTCRNLIHPLPISRDPRLSRFLNLKNHYFQRWEWAKVAKWDKDSSWIVVSLSLWLVEWKIFSQGILRRQCFNWNKKKEYLFGVSQIRKSFEIERDLSDKPGPNHEQAEI